MSSSSGSLRLLLREAERRGLTVPLMQRTAGPKAPERFSLAELRIRTKDRALVPLRVNQPQRLFLDVLLPAWRDTPYDLRARREILLKARQEGFSTLIQALFFLDTVSTPNTQTVVIAHDADSTERIFQMVQRFYRHLPLERRPVTQRANRREYYWPDLDSYFFVGTAGTGDYGRGGTINNVHGSEVALWPDAEAIVRGLLQAVPREGNIILESTANGLNNFFHDEYQRAKAGNSRYTPRFYGWNLLDEYRSPVPVGFTQTEEERGLAVRYGLDDEQLQWRREKKLELRGEFVQEFPLNDTEAFVSSGGRILSEFVDEPAERGGCRYEETSVPPADWRHFLVIDPGYNVTAVLFAAVDPEGTVWCYGEYYHGAKPRGERGDDWLPRDHMRAIDALCRAYSAVASAPIRWRVLMDPAGFNPTRTFTGHPKPPWDQEFRNAAKEFGADWYRGCGRADNDDPFALAVNRYLAAGRLKVALVCVNFAWEALRWSRKRQRGGAASEENDPPEDASKKDCHLMACARYLMNELPEPIPAAPEPEDPFRRVAGVRRPSASPLDPRIAP